MPDPAPERPRREPLDSPRLLALVVVLYALSIPWWAGGGAPTIRLGLPSWALASLGFTFAISVLTAFLALRRWSDDPADAPGGDPPERTAKTRPDDRPRRA